MALAQNFALLSASPKVGLRDLAPVAAAVMRQINEHFAPFWGLTGTVTPFASQDTVPLAYWRVTVVPGPLPNGMIGVHRAENNQPYAYVSDHGQWSAAVSHEVLEMLVDPTLSKFKAATLPGSSRRVNFLVEVCDPCQAVAYPVDGVAVSDFVTPSYFEPGSGGGTQYSYQRAIDRPYGVAANGYLVWHDPVSGRYTAYTTDGTTGRRVDLGQFPQGNFSPREWVDAALRREEVVYGDETLAALQVAQAEATLSARHEARFWKRQLQVLKKSRKPVAG